MTENQEAVYGALREHGPLPDHILVPIMQHEAELHQSSSGIRTRRNELANQGRVEPVSSVVMPSGREALVWAAV